MNPPIDPERIAQAKAKAKANAEAAAAGGHMINPSTHDACLGTEVPGIQPLAARTIDVTGDRPPKSRRRGKKK